MKKFTNYAFIFILLVVTFCFEIYIDPRFLSSVFDVGMTVLFFVVPVLIFRNKIFKVWLVMYVIYFISNIYIKIIPPNPNHPCEGILCGVDSRPGTIYFSYIVILIMLAMWQLVSFIQKRNSKVQL